MFLSSHQQLAVVDELLQCNGFDTAAVHVLDVDEAVPVQPHDRHDLAGVYPEPAHYFAFFAWRGGGTGRPARCAKIASFSQARWPSSPCSMAPKRVPTRRQS